MLSRDAGGRQFDGLGSNIVLLVNDHRICHRDYVKISFEDSGIGMSKEVQSHIFDPYFS